MLSAHVHGTGPLAYPEQDTRYPIYSIAAQWTEDGDNSDRDKYDAWWPNDPGPSRIWNAISTHRMMRKEDQAAAEKWAHETWWPMNRDAERSVGDGRPFSERNVRDLTITVKLSYYESWVCTWFSHETFDVGQSDEEALASFQRYVDRHAFYQDWPHDDDTDRKLESRGIHRRICLMGAEDRWRWSGGATPDERTDPPCRCEHCKAAGLLRIGH